MPYISQTKFVTSEHVQLWRVAGTGYKIKIFADRNPAISDDRDQKPGRTGHLIRSSIIYFLHGLYTYTNFCVEFSGQDPGGFVNHGACVPPNAPITSKKKIIR
jgi:hypothetical protein